MLRLIRRRAAQLVRLVRPPSLTRWVDPDWYLQRYPDVAAQKANPRKHFNRFGRKEGRFPSAMAEQLDRDFYLRRYPDVARMGIDPLFHFLSHGSQEGRFPNAVAEGRGFIGGGLGDTWGLDAFAPEHGAYDGSPPTDFDAAWYRKRNPEVMVSGLDPLEHYMTYGRAEGRSPSPSKESRESWAGRFDPTWYVARNPELGRYKTDPLGHFIHVGLLKDFAPNAREEDRAGWKGIFDPAWYLQRNPDVKAAGLDPLEHFISNGLVERRKPNKSTVLPSRPVLGAQIKTMKSGPLGDEVALFITHSTDGGIKPHVEQHISALKREGISVVLIVASDAKAIQVPPELARISDTIYFRANEGFDFAAWAHVLQINPDLFSANIVYFVNDSIFGPTNAADFAKMISRIRESQADFAGLTDNHERGWHIQSYFLAFKRSILSSQAFRNYIENIVSYFHKDDVINEYETQMTAHLIDAGFSSESLFTSKERRNSTVFRWKELLGEGFPYLKIGILRGLVGGIDISGWREMLSARGYDVKSADLSLAALAASSSMPSGTRQAAKYNFRQSSLVDLHRFFASGESITFASHAKPDVSIVIALYNQAELTYRCLKSITEAAGASIEVIIVDNNSTDDTRYLLSKVKNAKIFYNKENVHFLRAVNQGAEAARGKTILLLNNDTRIDAASLLYALETLYSADGIGAVGAKLVLPDGSLQEAGSIIWNNGECGGYGRGQSPEGFQFNFRREVDYCSGAFLLVRRDLFERLGRLDMAYAPAYYEETDLCMRIRASGFRIMYDPRIVVNHYEFGSSASSNEASSLMRRNLDTFVKRHRSTLQRLHLSKQAPLHLSRSCDRKRPRILMVENLLPLASHGAGFPRANAILLALVKAGYFVTYYAMHQGQAPLAEIHDQFPIDVEFVLGADRPSLTALIEQRAGYYDAMLVCRPENMTIVRSHFYENGAPYRNTALIYDAEAVSSPRDLMRRELHGERITAAETKATLGRELSISDIVDLTIVVNEHDAKYFRDFGRANVGALSHSQAAVPTPKTFPERRDLLFVGRLGDDRAPNVDALFWFIEEIMPRLDDLMGRDYRLIVAGPTGAPKLKTLKNDRVDVLGRVPDLTECYDNARVFLAPTRYAAGIPLKVYEAAAHGVPSVITPLLARQLGWNDGVDMLVGDNKDHFAEQCRRLYTDAALWNSVRSNGLAQVEAHCDPKRFDADLHALLRSVRLHGWS